MVEANNAKLKNEILRNLYDRVASGKGDRQASSSALRRAIQATVSKNYVEVLLEALVEVGYVREGSYGGKYSITEAGIELVESGWAYADAPRSIVDSWSLPDSEAKLTVSAIDTVRFHLAQCVTLIGTSSFSQEDKAQIIGLIRICEQIVDLPTPKLGLLKRILGWLKEIKELVPLIEAVLKLIGKA